MTYRLCTRALLSPREISDDRSIRRHSAEEHRARSESGGGVQAAKLRGRHPDRIADRTNERKRKRFSEDRYHKMRPELSIVIAVRDNWRQLAECVDSIAAQYRPPSLEIVVVDDGSLTPPSAKAVDSMRQLQLRLVRQTGLGIAAARNRGLELTEGEIILFVDSDCLLERHCLRNLGEATKCHVDEVAFQFSISSLERNLVQEIDALRLQMVQESLLLGSGHILYVNTSGFAVRSSYVAETESFFDVSAVRGSDTIKLAQLIRQGKEPRFLSKCKVFHCPEISFLKYALKCFGVGYHDSYSHKQLRASGDVLLGWTQKFQALRRTWSMSQWNAKRVRCSLSALVCFSIEKLGRSTSRVINSHPGDRNFLSVRMDVIRRSELIYRIVTSAQRKRSLLVSYANAWTLVQAKRSRSFQSALSSTDICFVDGVGVELAAILLNQPKVRKTSFNDTIFDLCRELADRNLSIALIGGEGAVLREASATISKVVPPLNIVLQSPGYLSQAEEESLKTELPKRKPNVILIGMGQPRQEQWAVRMRPLLPESVICCVGGLFDYVAGPRGWADFARGFGLEWAFRLCNSPKKTAERYLFGIPALFGYIITERARQATKFVQR
jgi:exopolysaccharide biosynthesis WecB/TagA/CpsF family protein